MQTLRPAFWTSFLLAAVLFLTPVTNVLSVPLWDVDFTGDTVGQNPATATATAGAVNTSPTALTNVTATGNSFLVAENYSVGSTTLTGRSVVLSYTAGSSNPQVWFGGDAADVEAGVPFTLSFTALLNDAQSAGGNLLTVFINDGGGSLLARATFRGNGELTLYDSSGSTNTVFSSATPMDTILNVEFRILLDQGVSGTFQAVVNNSSIGSIPLALADPSAVGLRTFRFERHSGTNGFEVGLANIQVIPEPSTAAALLFGTMAMVFMNRRRSRRA